MNNDMFNSIFGPLGKEYCAYFYFLSVINFVFFAFIIVGTLLAALTKRKDSSFVISMILVAFAYGIGYFQTRLLHTMCLGSV
jgi:hypothetical protein